MSASEIVIAISLSVTSLVMLLKHIQKIKVCFGICEVSTKDVNDDLNDLENNLQQIRELLDKTQKTTPRLKKSLPNTPRSTAIS